MANPFDEFDALPATPQKKAEVNPFDEFDNAPAVAVKPTITPQVAAEPSLLESAQRFGKDFGFGVGKSVADTAAGLQQMTLPGALRRAAEVTGLVEQAKPNAIQEALNKGYEASESGGAGAGKLVGDIATGWIPGAKAGAAVEAAPFVAKLLRGGGGAQKLGKAISGAAQGAAQSAVLGQDAGDIAQGAAFGGTVGAILPRISEAAKKLMDKGITPSLGQAVGGITNKLEQRLTSLPIAGDVIEKVRGRAAEQFSKQAIQKATSGAADTLESANKYASQLYQEAVPLLKPTSAIPKNVSKTMAELKENPDLTDDQLNRLQKLVGSKFGKLGEMKGEQLKNLDSELGFISREHSGFNASPSDRSYGRAVSEIQSALREGLEAGAPKEVAAKLRQANQIYRDLVPINRAASSRADELITPRRLEKELARQAKKDVTRMPKNEFIEAAKQVLPANVPDSGTAGRMFLTGAIVNNPMLLAGGVGAAGVAKLLNSKAVLNALRSGSLQRALTTMGVLSGGDENAPQ